MEYNKKSLLSILYIYLFFSMDGIYTAEITPLIERSLQFNLKSSELIRRIPLGCNFGEFIKYKYPDITPAFWPPLYTFVTIWYSNNSLEKKITYSFINALYYLLTIYPDFQISLKIKAPNLNKILNTAHDNISFIRASSAAYCIYSNYDSIKDVIKHYPEYINNIPFTTITPFKIIYAWNFLGYIASAIIPIFNTKAKQNTEDTDEAKTKDSKNPQIICKNILENILPTAGSLYTAYLAHLGHRDTQKTLWFLTLIGANIGMKKITPERAGAILGYIFVTILYKPFNIC